MELDISNLYANGGFTVDFDNNNKELYRKILPYKKQNGDKKHIIVQGDTIEKIAFLYYQGIKQNAGRYWFYIVDCNKDIITNPLDLSSLVGKQIIIPDVFRIDF